MSPMKIQPIDIDSEKLAVVRNDAVKPVLKSRLKRLFVFDRQFSNASKTSTNFSEKPITGEVPLPGDKSDEPFEPSSVALAKMVQSFIEESNEKQNPVSKLTRNRCNCFNGNSNDSSDEELDFFGESIATGSFNDAGDALKSLIPCASVAERNLLADASKIVDKNSKVFKRKNDLRKIVAENLQSLGYDSSICKTKWHKTKSHPAGDYEYIDVFVEGERLIIDIDFRSEFEIARSTGTFKAILQFLPYIFVGKSDRLRQIVTVVSEAAKQSLKKKGMPVPPWRKSEYMLAKWLSTSCTRVNPSPSPITAVTDSKEDLANVAAESDCGEWELIFGEKISLQESETVSGGGRSSPSVAMPTWQLPEVKVKSVEKGAKVVTGFSLKP